MNDPLATQDAPRRSLRARTVHSSSLELTAFAARQALRLVSNLVLTRLLFPEAFGLMAIVQVFIQGLELLSDVGIRAAVVQSPRGAEPSFLDTVWTLQVVRGLLLWLIAVAVAVPAARVYGEPQLSALLMVGSLSVVASGFNSTALITLRRELRIAPVVAIDVVSHALAIAAMIAFAAWKPTVWALVVGHLLRAVLVLVAGHVAWPDRLNKLAWDPAVVRSIYHFGKWIFLSSTFHFLSRQADRLLLARYIGMDGLGVYSVAYLLSEAAGTAVERLTSGVLFPAFSEVGRERTPRLRQIYYRARLPLDLTLLPGLGLLAALGSIAVSVLYDARYQEAGWMLELLCIRVAMHCTLAPAETCLFSLGHTRYAFLRSVARAFWVVIGIPVGWHLGGVHAMVAVIASSEVPVLAVLWTGLFRHGLLRPSRELLAALLFAAGWLGGRLVEPWLASLLPS